jgi:hypothetical protein
MGTRVRGHVLSNEYQIFADGISNVVVTGTIVRIDFVAMSPTHPEAGGQPRMEFTHRVIMPLDGFLRSANKIQETVQVLVKHGLVRTAPQVAGPTSAEGEQGQQPETGRKPNDQQGMRQFAASAVPMKDSKVPFP